MKKEINVKTLMVFALLTTSIFAMPIMSRADDGGDDGPGMDPSKFGDAFGAFGPGGEMLQQIFGLLFDQALALGDQKMLEGSTSDGGVYVLNASRETTYDGTYDFASEGDNEETHFLPYLDNGTGENGYYDQNLNGWAYCKVEKSGSFTYNLTVGASLTLVIWDEDGSFIVAAKKIIDFGIKISQAAPAEMQNILLTEGIELATWLIVHINDIFTGDELFVFNPITWQKFEMEPQAGFKIKKSWYDFGPNGYMNNGGGDDVNISLTDPNLINMWNNTANNTKDNYMQWLLTTWTAPLAKEIWTHFSFDIFQLWIKNFEIHIDLSGLSSLVGGTGTPNIADVFGGLDIEFYLFTHHLEGAFLYNDLDSSNDITVNYTEFDVPIDAVTNETAMRPDSNEVTHRIMLGTVGDFIADDPTKIDDDSLSWGLTLQNADIIPIPVGVDLNSYVGAERENLPFIEFKLKFIRALGEPDADGNRSATGAVKLQHNFGPWNGGNPKSNIDDLDLAIVYVSSIFHFHLNIENKNEEASELTQAEDDKYFQNETVTSEKGLWIGNYLDASGEDLEFIDIAGDNYILNNATTPTGGDSYPASSQIVPIGLNTFSGNAHAVHTGNDTTADDFSTGVSLTLSHNVMYYGICYPQFNGSGVGIWHDPTFNIYMVFTPSSAGFWALILLIAAVGLAGVATIMIKKKKDREGF